MDSCSGLQGAAQAWGHVHSAQVQRPQLWLREP